jgi:hypothetical protein
MHSLLLAIVLDNEVLRAKPIHNFALRAFYQRGNHYHIRLSMESCFLGNSAAGQQRQ